MKAFAACLLLVSSALSVGASAAPFEYVFVPVSQFGEPLSDFRLANEIVQYDLAYLESKVPAFDGSVRNGISFNAAVDTSGSNEAQVRIQLDCGNAALVAVKEELADQLKNYFANLAEKQAEMYSLYYSRGPIRAYWVDGLFESPGSSSYKDLSPTLQAQVPPEEWDSFCGSLQKNFGEPDDTWFMMGQFYEAFDSRPEMVVLSYKVISEEHGTLNCQIIESDESGEWTLLGVNISPSESSGRD